MNKKLEKKLVEKYPKILVDYGGNPMQTCLAWGFECNDGWFNLLDEAMQKLQYLCDKFSTPDNEVQVIATQIKEKFGTLSFYTQIVGANKIESELLYDVIDQAEILSSKTCEESGEKGALCIKGGWYRTLSRELAKKYEYIPVDVEVKKYWEALDKKEENRKN